MATTIAIEDLRVGMYVQLDGGWLSHPFPLSSFRIAAAEQINTLRGLGLARVRWVPEKSELPPAHPEFGADDVKGDTALAEAPPAAPSPVELAAAQRREWLAAQREAARRCERQYGEAAQAWRQALDAVARTPEEAGRSTRALTQAMLDKMLATEDVVIRLVHGGSDRDAAHALNVSVVSMLIGRTLGLNEADLGDLGVGALLHDVGKQEVAERHRHHDEGFGTTEMAAYRDHVAKGMALGRRMALSVGALAVLGQHHEHTDGSGFPLHLNSDRVTMGARIVAIVNRYDNLCNPSTHTAAPTPHEAVAMLFAQGRTRYDTTVLTTFIRMMGVYPAGSLVQLTDDRYAMVVGVNSSRPLKPRVLVHDEPHSSRGAAPQQATQLLDLEQTPDLGIRRSLAATKVPAAVLQSLDPRPRVAYYFESIARDQHGAALAA